MSEDDTLIDSLRNPESTHAIPNPIPGNQKRQTVHSIPGLIYQTWWSIDAWLQLVESVYVIHLEGAEDFEIMKYCKVNSVQVKKNQGGISFGTLKAHEVLEHYWF